MQTLFAVRGNSMNRCVNCGQPHHRHHPRREAPPVCPDHISIYVEMTEEQLDAAYKQAFPDGPVPIATFRTDSPEDLARAVAALSPEALNGFFSPGGGGMPAFMAAMEAKP